MDSTVHAEQKKMNADTKKTTLNWHGEKVLGKHTGTILLKEGWLHLNNNMITAGEFHIDMTSIKDDDSNERLEGHLKSDDFFGVEKHPLSKIVIIGSEAFDKGSSLVKGNLTIKGITLPLEFMVKMEKADEGIWFNTHITVDRSKYNVRYGSGSFFDNLGDKAIHDEFRVKVNLYMN
jgi:polyisoprenoid-binding protein YceI